ncbi:pentapeptide repeat-containing protein [Secundilactobacillus malefermentans]|uniref:pentapeptide repeat-containing protein n=1 Tax=Secundilactobacillus malefermentans TaxID=176292 RepID=UPI0011CB46CC|nr:pentapeptide repeat-containing protein [Secundilactobacillus malefermentans]QEA31545.1 pentapeptide repeat-containing protein [Secundilactobacillus malefermentans]
MPNNTVEHQTLSLDDVEMNYRYVDCTFTYSNKSIRLTNVTLSHCKFEQSNFDDAEWSGCTLDHLDWLNITAHNNAFFDCVFQDSLLMGADFTGSQFKRTTFDSCKATYLNLSETGIEAVTFNESQLIDSAFQAIKVKKHLTFKGCELTGIDLSDSNLSKVDISASYFDTLQLTLDRIAGLTISPLQATQIITLLGVKISDR